MLNAEYYRVLALLIFLYFLASKDPSSDLLLLCVLLYL